MKNGDYSHSSPANFIDRDEISEAIHSRAPVPCARFLRGRKMVIAYPSLKDRIRYNLGLSENGSYEVDKIHRLIHHIGRPFGDLESNNTVPTSRRWQQSTQYNSAFESLKSALELAHQIDTDKHYLAESKQKYNELLDRLKQLNFKTVERDVNNDGQELLFSSCMEKLAPRLRIRWEQFPHNHSIQIIEDSKFQGDLNSNKEAECSIEKSFLNFRIDAFTSLSEHLFNASPRECACDCASIFACKPIERNCIARGDHRNALAEFLVPRIFECWKDGKLEPKKPADKPIIQRQPEAGLLVVADYWLVPIESFLEQKSVKKIIESRIKEEKKVADARDQLISQAKTGLAKSSEDIAELLEAIMIWAREWFKINEGGADRLDREDFVFTYLSDRRALLLSDLRPDKNVNGRLNYPDGESRTIIIDLGMFEEERGRVLHRLMDIATFRQLSLRGYPYVKKATNSITQLDVALNEINLDEKLDPGKKLKIILGLTLSTDLLNLFFTYGVSGRWESLVRSSKRIEQNLSLLRENRIPGNQTLAGYLERYFWTVGDIEVLRSRYVNLRSRIDNVTNLVKTEFESKQSRRLSQLTLIAASAAIVATVVTLLGQVELISEFISSWQNGSSPQSPRSVDPSFPTSLQPP